ncbi:MAG TPA: hypothetical protein VLI39_06835 [Sedimentisphaerales bacterium]|nr:hypothetical protein [Sedimentisphaerales bacterium]
MREHSVRRLLLGVVVLLGSEAIAVERSDSMMQRELAGVFLEGQVVRVAVPAEVVSTAAPWRVVDDRAALVRSGTLTPSGSSVELGALGIGWYRVEFLGPSGETLAWTTAAVLARLAAPISEDSPICLDSATAWFARDDRDKQDRLALLASLAGTPWVRDRLRWRDMQPTGPREFAGPETTYDTSAGIQTARGLKVLQVFHDTPKWAVAEGDTTGRYAGDLRDVYRFCKAMAMRFRGTVHAWEPWNEGNVATFGGHTTDEMCSYQKAAYLGFKAGDPNVLVCWNVSTAVPTRLHTSLVLQNETWPYFDTYNTHTYDWPDSYERLWKPVHDAACGRPIWVTESDRGIAYATPEPWCDLSREGEIRKAEFMAQSYVSSLFAGADRHFHFILGHYCEGGKIQFGLLRLDETPRPSYVALAAVGRFLDGARCLGRWDLDGKPDTHVYAFRAKPDGKACDVLVAWAEKPGDWDQRGKTVVDWKLPAELRVEGAYDYLGRSLNAETPGQLRSTPVFVLLREGDAGRLPLVVPQRSAWRSGKPNQIVLQLHMPRSTSVNIEQIPWASDIEHKVQPDMEIDLPLYAYNFSESAVRGRIVVEHAPIGWRLAPSAWDVALEPMGRQRLDCRFLMPERQAEKSSDTWIILRGDFGTEAKPVLAFRLISQPGEGYEALAPIGVR